MTECHMLRKLTTILINIHVDSTKKNALTTHVIRAKLIYFR